MSMTVTYVDEARMMEIEQRIVGLLAGVPLSQALALLERRVPELLKIGHVVDPDSPRFRTVCAAFAESHCGSVG